MLIPMHVMETCRRMICRHWVLPHKKYGASNALVDEQDTTSYSISTHSWQYTQILVILLFVAERLEIVIRRPRQTFLGFFISDVFLKRGLNSGATSKPSRMLEDSQSFCKGDFTYYQRNVVRDDDIRETVISTWGWDNMHSFRLPGEFSELAADRLFINIEQGLEEGNLFFLIITDNQQTILSDLKHFYDDLASWFDETFGYKLRFIVLVTGRYITTVDGMFIKSFFEQGLTHAAVIADADCLPGYLSFIYKHTGWRILALTDLPLNFNVPVETDEDKNAIKAIPTPCALNTRPNILARFANLHEPQRATF
jgi:hypothetical protein